MNRNIGINVGVSKEAVKELGMIILDILNSESCDESTKVAALDTLKNGCQTTAQVQNCSLEVK